MGYSLEQMARWLVESGDYRVTSRLEPQAEYHPPDNSPKLVAAVVDVETTGMNPDRDKIIEFGICLFEGGWRCARGSPDGSRTVTDWWRFRDLPRQVAPTHTHARG